MGKGSKTLKPPATVSPLLGEILKHVESRPAWEKPFDAHRHLTDRLKRLRAMQSSSNFFVDIIPKRTEESANRVLSWLNEQEGGDMRSVQVGSMENRGMGLIARKDLRKGDPYVQVAEKMMIFGERIEGVGGGEGGKESLLLALRLMKEAGKKGNVATYIEGLPNDVMPMFSWSSELLQKAGEWGERMTRVLRAQTRDYCYVYGRVVKKAEGRWMSWSNYEWAVSMVMSRQNIIGGRLCLIPGWDMGNYDEDGVRTSIVGKNGQIWIEGICEREVKKGEEVKMWYGERGNGELLMFAGFVVNGNKADSVPIWMRLGTEKLAMMKARMWGKWGGAVRERQSWEIGERVGREDAKKIMDMARVVTVQKDELVLVMREGREGLKVEEESKRLAIEVLEEEIQERRGRVECIDKDDVDCRLLMRLLDEEVEVLLRLLSDVNGITV